MMECVRLIISGDREREGERGKRPVDRLIQKDLEDLSPVQGSPFKAGVRALGFLVGGVLADLPEALIEK